MKIFDDQKFETAEEYRMYASAHKKAMKDNWMTFLKTGVFVLVSLIVLVFIALAWFAMNDRVNGVSSTISTGMDIPYYIATKVSDEQGVYDFTEEGGNSALSSSLNIKTRKDNTGRFNLNDFFTSFLSLPSIIKGESTVIANDNQEYYKGDSQGISLMVNSDSNVNNKNQGDFMGPGTKGAITFYIIPTSDNLTSVNLTLSLSAYQILPLENSEDKNVGKASLVKENRVVRNLLTGHILIFQNQIQGNYSNRIIPTLEEDGTLSFQFTETGTNWKKNDAIPITIYWNWPRHFENYIYEGLENSIFSSSTVEMNNLLNWVNANKGNIVNTNTTNIGDLQSANKNMSNSDLYTWAQGYNKGDQLIGDTVAYFEWTIQNN